MRQEEKTMAIVTGQWKRIEKETVILLARKRDK
jgi:hypothetical protein